ncbi:hypothetical protein Tco_0881973 [Tanacetum coccineum]
MSDSDDSTVTYMAVSSPFEGLSNIGSPGVDGPPMMPEDPYAYVVAAFYSPPSPDYVSGPKDIEQAPFSLEFVLELVYLEFMPPKDDVLPSEEQPLAEDLEEDPADYPADGGNYDDDDDDESSDDNEDDDDDVEEDEDEDEEEEEEHPAPADSVPPPVHRVTARMSIRDPTYPLGYRAAMIRLRAETLSTSHPLPSSTPPSGTPPLLPIPVPTPSPPLLLPSINHRADRPEVYLPPRKRLCIALGPRYEVGESSSAPAARPTRGFKADYGAPATDETELGKRLTDFVTTVRQDTDKIYGRLDDAQYDRSLMSDRLNMLFRDRCAHARTALLMEREARLSHEAWAMDASDTAHSEVGALRTTTQVMALQSQLGPASGPAQPEIPEEAGSSS